MYQCNPQSGPEDVSLLERCPHFRGWYIQASMELGPEGMSQVHANLLRWMRRIDGSFQISILLLASRCCLQEEQYLHRNDERGKRC